MISDKLKEEKPLNKFLEKVEKCKERCQTDEGKEHLGDLEFKLVDEFLQNKFHDFE